jgi:hypothetical protein
MVAQAMSKRPQGAIVVVGSMHWGGSLLESAVADDALRPDAFATRGRGGLGALEVTRDGQRVAILIGKTSELGAFSSRSG